MNPLDLTADKILAAKSADEIYSRNSYDIEWTKLRSKWHPDKGVDNHHVFQHLKMLYESIPQLIKTGVWNKVLVMTDVTINKTYEFRFSKQRPFELGEIYISHKHVAYAVTYDNADLFEHGVKMIKSLKFPDIKIKAEVSRYVPEIVAVIKTEDRHILIIKKDHDLISLRDVLDHLSSKLNSKHVAWIMSRCYNLGCYLKLVAGISHGDLSLDSYFISPEDHRGALLGGWWYAQELNKKLIALPPRTLNLDLPLGDPPKASPKIFGELIKALGRELLGDINGTKLLMNPDLKKPMTMWLRSPASDDSLKEYSTWMEDVLKASFGPRKWVDFKLKASDIYV